MDHKEVLDFILAHQCPDKKENDIREFTLELCCDGIIRITAKYLGLIDDKYRYQILEYELIEEQA